MTSGTNPRSRPSCRSVGDPTGRDCSAATCSNFHRARRRETTRRSIPPNCRSFAETRSSPPSLRSSAACRPARILCGAGRPTASLPPARHVDEGNQHDAPPRPPRGRPTRERPRRRSAARPARAVSRARTIQQEAAPGQPASVSPRFRRHPPAPAITTARRRRSQLHGPRRWRAAMRTSAMALPRHHGDLCCSDVLVMVHGVVSERASRRDGAVARSRSAGAARTWAVPPCSSPISTRRPTARPVESREVLAPIPFPRSSKSRAPSSRTSGVAAVRGRGLPDRSGRPARFAPPGLLDSSPASGPDPVEDATTQLRRGRSERIVAPGDLEDDGNDEAFVLGIVTLGRSERRAGAAPDCRRRRAEAAFAFEIELRGSRNCLFHSRWQRQVRPPVVPLAASELRRRAAAGVAAPAQSGSARTWRVHSWSRPCAAVRRASTSIASS